MRNEVVRSGCLRSTMFKSFFGLFSSGSAKTPAQNNEVAQSAQPAPGSTFSPTPQSNVGESVKRDENMVKKLTDDHRVLLTMYGQVMREADDGQWRVVQQKIVEFQSVLTDHLLLETVKVYSYLKQRYKNDEDISASIQDFSTEMNGIRKHVVVTLASFSDIAVNTTKQHAFREVWRSIGTALGNRIQREEKSLYPLY
jgi:hypothetical protein